MYKLRFKPIVFLGLSLEALREFPAEARRESGYELDKIQRGIDPKDRKALPGIGSGVREIRIQVGNAWRIIYIVNRKDAVYVLHAFQKKMQKTAKHDVALIKSALKELK